MMHILRSCPAECEPASSRPGSFISDEGDRACRKETGEPRGEPSSAIPSTESLLFVERTPVGTSNSDARSYHVNLQDDGLWLKFQRLVLRWREEKRFTSSLDKMILCPSHRRILAMGEPAVQFIMEYLRVETSDHWFRTLEILTGEQPVRHEDRGDYAKMRQAWLEWWDNQT